MKTLVNASVRMSPALHARVLTLAEVRQRSPRALMLQAIEDFVTKEEKREAWRQEGLAAWEDYQRTGLHLTNTEVKDWLTQLATGNNVEPPKCHP